MSRRKLRDYIPKTSSVLEIGPLDAPFLLKEDYDVYYADIRTHDELLKLNSKLNWGKTGIVPVDYVIEKTYIESVGIKRFQAVFSSHVIEHTYDVIGHLNEIAQILETNAYYALCIPDKRFTFDYFREVTPFRDAYDMCTTRSENVLKRLIIDSKLNTSGWIAPENSLNHSVSQEKLLVNENIVDISVLSNEEIYQPYHFWVFTFPSFLTLIRDCLRLNLLPFTLEYAGGTTVGDIEFQIVLKKNNGITTDIEMRREEILKVNRLIEYPKGYNELIDFFDKYSQIYVYGSNASAMFIMEKVKEKRRKICGVIISDGYEKNVDFCLPVFFISEVQPKPDFGIVLAMSCKSNADVYVNLIKQGFNNILENPLVD